MSETHIKVLTAEERLNEQVVELRAQVYNLSAELKDYRDEASSWLQMKVKRQALALTRLNKRVRVQRLMLRELTERDPQMSNDLFFTVKDKYKTELDDDIILHF